MNSCSKAIVLLPKIKVIKPSLKISKRTVKRASALASKTPSNQSLKSTLQNFHTLKVNHSEKKPSIELSPICRERLSFIQGEEEDLQLLLLSFQVN